MNSNYKELHEDFVSHHTGTSSLEVLLTCLVQPFLVLSVVQLVCCWGISLSFWADILLHLVAVIIPSLLIVTILYEHLIIIILTLLVLNTGLWFAHVGGKPMNLYQFIVNNRFQRSHQTAIHDLRAHWLLSTAVCILAVDFPIFPRQLAKTENYGFSCMDAGVGCFVMANGLVAPEARASILHSSTWQCLKKSFRSALPLLILGFGRMIAVKGTNYYEHVSEYGVHWNFFLTLAFTKVFSSLALLSLPHAFPAGLLALLILATYQYLLDHQGLKEYILGDERDGLLSANKEGICSLFGYVAIYLAAVQIGRLVFKQSSHPRGCLKSMLLFWTCGLVGWAGMLLLHSNLQPASRRMANATYCTWTVSLKMLLLGVHQFMLLLAGSRSPNHDISTRQTKELGTSSDDSLCLLWKAINYNGLFFFLLSNVLTGIINLSVDTLQTSVITSLVLLTVYSYTLCLMAGIFLYSSILIKFW